MWGRISTPQAVSEGRLGKMLSISMGWNISIITSHQGKTSQTERGMGGISAPQAVSGDLGNPIFSTLRLAQGVKVQGYN